MGRSFWPFPSLLVQRGWFQDLLRLLGSPHPSTFRKQPGWEEGDPPCDPKPRPFHNVSLSLQTGGCYGPGDALKGAQPQGRWAATTCPVWLDLSPLTCSSSPPPVCPLHPPHCLSVCLRVCLSRGWQPAPVLSSLQGWREGGRAGSASESQPVPGLPPCSCTLTHAHTLSLSHFQCHKFPRLSPPLAITCASVTALAPRWARPSPLRK